MAVCQAGRPGPGTPGRAGPARRAARRPVRGRARRAAAGPAARRPGGAGKVSGRARGAGMTAAGPAFSPSPARGRVFTTAARVVRSTDVTPAGRLRFDALARYLQEAAEDDLADAGWSG